MWFSIWITDIIRPCKMKTLKLIIVLVIFTILISCDHKEVTLTSNTAVENYIRLLKTNRYDSLSLPDFTSNDIPALLIYRNETQIITNFPHNGISSLFMPDCTLGMYVLWTIESIRAVAIHSNQLIGRFPSQNPILSLRDSTTLKLVYNDLSLKIAAESYFKWWENYKHTDFEVFKNIDPLSGTSYKWH